MSDTKTMINTYYRDDLGVIRTVLIDDVIWFVGKDVATILGYSNTKDAINRHIEKEDKKFLQKSQITTLDFQIPNRGLTIINESGLYSLILSSRLPNAKKFKHWVTSVILPEIRKTGSYNSNNSYEDKFKDLTEQLLQSINLINKQIEFQNKVMEEKQKRNGGYSTFKARIWEKINLLKDYLNIDAKTVMKNLFIETQNRYEIDFTDYKQECSYQTGIENPFTLEIINCNSDLRKMFECTINDVLDNYGLEYKRENCQDTIFSQIKKED